MKKLFMVLSVAGVIALSSCSKEFECNCVDSSGASVAGVTSSYEGKASGSVYEAAKSFCEENNPSTITCTFDEV